MILLGIDIGSSSIKVNLVDGEKGTSLASASYPAREMEILSVQNEWAEQDPNVWMENLTHAIELLKSKYSGTLKDIGAIGITYQMHGLVAVDKHGKLVRNAIIWCDSRAVSIGEKAFYDLGEQYCLSNLLNSPGNFTASKLKWVKENEPDNFKKIRKIMLPGDYVAYRLTGEIRTTNSGLSEGIFWDFETGSVSGKLLDYYGFDNNLLPEVSGTFSHQAYLSTDAANLFGLKANIPVSYRAGDQPNNALSLNVLNPGEVAATAGTSGVVYGVTDKKKHDPFSRVNTFLHVNHTPENPRLGILLCLNSTGILNSWAKHQLMTDGLSYEEMNGLAQLAPPGSEGLLVLPFGNGAERVLKNINVGASFHGVNFNIHKQSHILRALQEGIVFSMNYGLEIMEELGLDLTLIRAGKANMFLSNLFRKTFADISGAKIELYNTDGSEGAARGAGIGVGFYQDEKDAFSNLKVLETIHPEVNNRLEESYKNWKSVLNQKLLNC